MVHYTEHSPGRIVPIKGKEYLYFGGTSYLGLPPNEEFQELLIHNVRRFGSSHGASRVSNLRLNIFERVEKYLAGWAGSEAALTLSSGFMAGQLLAHFFGNGLYESFYAPNVHAALLPARGQAYRNFSELSEAVMRYFESKHTKPAVIFMDSLDFNGDAFPDFKALRTLPMDELMLVVDDSHGFGIIGKDGGGAFQNLAALQPKELVVCASLAKALGLQGGVVFCSDTIKNKLWTTAFFTGASPAPPAHMATLTDARHLYRKQQMKLQDNIVQFEGKWQNRQGFRYLPGYPVYLYDNKSLTESLETHNILVTDFPYPSLQAGAVSGRIVLSAHHQPEDILQLTSVLNSSIHSQKDGIANKL